LFLSEGIQKFLFPAALGYGRFAKIGIPAPQFTGPFVGAVEILCGAMLIFGLATIPLLIDIVVAIATRKFAVLGEQGF
jgi:putative oxidoreductase